MRPETPRVRPSAGRPPERHLHVPDHRLLRCIGHGSYGSVWLAQSIIGSFRAVKVVYRDDFEDERPFEREFKGIQKFEPISRQHDSQVDILHVGRTGDGFYYVMEVADDERLGQEIDPVSYRPRTLASELKRRGRLSFDECVQVGLSLTTALRHLHTHGLIHQDIKPANVIFVNGVPKLADIGLITETNAARSFVGTEGFIPPEGQGTVRGDIYSLGKVLYELATGRDRRDFPELPTLLRESLEKEKLVELNEVILRACELDPNRRYGSAEEMHADLALLQTGQSIRRHRLTERRLRTARRVAVAAVGVAVVAGTTYYEARRAERLATQRLVQMNVVNGLGLVKAGDTLGALPWFARAVELGHGQAALEEANRLRIASILAQAPRLSQVFFHEGIVVDAEFSPDGERLVTASHDGTARVWDLTTGQGVGSPLMHSAELTCAAFSPDGRWVVTASNDHTARVWEASTGRPVSPPLRHGAEVAHAAFSPDGRRVLTASWDKTARIWDAQTGELLVPPLEHPARLSWAAFSPDGRRVVAASWDGTAQMWATDTGRAISPPLRHANHQRVRIAMFSPGGRQVATAGEDRTARLWDAATRQPLTAPLRHSDGIVSMAFSPDGTLLATASKDRSAQIWDTHTGEPVSRRMSHDGMVRYVAFSPDGRWVITASTDHSARIWNARTGEPITSPLTHSGGVITASISPNGHTLVTAGHDRTVRVWGLSGQPPSVLAGMPSYPSVWAGFGYDGSYLATYTGFDSRIRVWKVGGGPQPSLTERSSVGWVQGGLQYFQSYYVCFSPVRDRSWLLYTDGSEARLWDFQTGRFVAPPMKHAPVKGQTNLDASKVVSSCFSPDARWIATASLDHTARVWEAATGRPVTPSLDHGVKVYAVGFSPDGRRLVTGCGEHEAKTNGYARVWNARTGQPLTAPLLQRGAVTVVSFSPDGRQVLTGCDDVSTEPMTAQIWNAATGRPIGPPLRHGDGINSARYSPDGTRVLTASQDSTARIWNAATGEPATPPLPHPRQVQDAGFSPDGRWVVTACLDGTLRLWEAATGQLVAPPLGVIDGAEHLWFHVAFTSDGRRVLAANGADSTVWDVPSVNLSPAALVSLGEALTGQRLDQTGAAVPMELPALRKVWREARADHPELFATSLAEIVMWHQTQAAACERDHDWFALLFHLDRWLALQPGDPGIVTRRAAAKAALDQAH